MSKLREKKKTKIKKAGCHGLASAASHKICGQGEKKVSRSSVTTISN